MQLAISCAVSCGHIIWPELARELAEGTHTWVLHRQPWESASQRRAVLPHSAAAPHDIGKAWLMCVEQHRQAATSVRAGPVQCCFVAAICARFAWLART